MYSNKLASLFNYVETDTFNCNLVFRRRGGGVLQFRIAATALSHVVNEFSLFALITLSLFTTVRLFHRLRGIRRKLDGNRSPNERSGGAAEGIERGERGAGAGAEGGCDAGRARRCAG